MEQLFGVVEFAGHRSRDNAKLVWWPGGPSVIHAAFDVPFGGTLEGWRNRVLKHRGEAVFIAAGGYQKLRIPDAEVGRCTEVTGVEIGSVAEPVHIG